MAAETFTSYAQKEDELENQHEFVDQDISIIGPTLKFKGELSAEEDLLIRGHIEGKIHHKSKLLIIGEEGTVKADIDGSRVVTEGTVEGDIHGSDSTVIKTSAHVRGNIYSPRVGIEAGAKFKGSIDMDVGGAAEKSWPTYQKDEQKDEMEMSGSEFLDELENYTSEKDELENPSLSSAEDEDATDKTSTKASNKKNRASKKSRSK